jgi:ABC-type transporter Mla subunit MlaD
MKKGDPITIQGKVGKIAKIKIIPADKSRSGWKEWDITIVFDKTYPLPDGRTK